MRWINGTAGMIAIMAVCGCAENKPRVVGGRVTLKGQPLTSGIVQFHGPGDRMSASSIEPDGTFNVSNIVPGEVRVTVVEDETGAIPGGMPGMAKPNARKIPAIYADPITSGLTYSITPKTTEIVIELK